MEKATNKDTFKKYREREAAETTGTRSGRKYKETYKGAKMMALLVEGTQLKYMPWGGRDVETLKSKLPSLRDGANRWIATFEDETVGDMIAVWDIKVLLSKARAGGYTGIRWHERCCGLRGLQWSIPKHVPC